MINSHDNLEQTVTRTIRRHRLIKKSGKVAVAVSGGKDSTTLLYILHKFGYNVTGIMIDLKIGKYSGQNRHNITSFCKSLRIPLNIIDIRDHVGYSMCYIRSALSDRGASWNACMVCGALKRYILNKVARQSGFDVIATGHNMDDESQTMIMNILRGSPENNLRIGPRAGVRLDTKFIPRIKPLYQCTEAEIESYSRSKGFPVVYEPCPCSEGVFRRNLIGALKGIEKRYPDYKENVIKAMAGHQSNLKSRFKIGHKVQEHCIACGEPSKGPLCFYCQLLEKIGCPVRKA